jgi:hypothetical protein
MTVPGEPARSALLDEQTRTNIHDAGLGQRSRITSSSTSNESPIRPS